MGIYDRDYYRGSTRQSPWVSGQTPAVHGLIAVTIAVFVLQLVSPAVTKLLAYDPVLVQRWELWRLVTYAFCHGAGNLWHILWNMLWLYWFGRDLEAMYGTWEFLRFYLAAAVIAALCQWALTLADVVNPLPMVGASGAVAAVVFLYTLYYPRQQVLILGIFPLELRWLAAFFLVSNLLPMFQHQETGVANAAHLGGAAYGILYKLFDLRFSKLLSGRFSLPRFRLSNLPWRRRPRIRVVIPPEDEALDHRVDELLAKIAREGLNSLTAQERRLLQRASDLYKNRRH